MTLSKAQDIQEDTGPPDIDWDPSEAGIEQCDFSESHILPRCLTLGTNLQLLQSSASLPEGWVLSVNMHEETEVTCPRSQSQWVRELRTDHSCVWLLG